MHSDFRLLAKFSPTSSQRRMTWCTLCYEKQFHGLVVNASNQDMGRCDLMQHKQIATPRCTSVCFENIELNVDPSHILHVPKSFAA